MKTLFSIAAIVVASLLSGCHLSQQNAPGVQHPALTTPAANTNDVALATEHARTEAARINKPAIVTPDTSLMAKVVKVNEVGRFVIVGFPNTEVPKLQQSMFLYRAGLKVAEVKVIGPQDGNNIVAEIISGDVKMGDTVRSN